MNLILFLALVFLMTFLIGKLLERIRIPWIFSAMVIGIVLSLYNPFAEITASPAFSFLAELGMYFLLFIIGFELNITKIFKSGRFVVKTTVLIILAETLLGGLLVHWLFHASWLVSFLVASSFATVGEAVLLPILDEFKLVNTKLGQLLIGIGVLDDIVEVVTIIIASVLIGRALGYSPISIWLNLLILILLFSLTIVLVKFRRFVTSFKYKDVPSFFLFVIFFFFLFIGIGGYMESTALGALLAGIALRNMIPVNILSFIESEMRIFTYGFFAPIFFLSIGLSVDFSSLYAAPLLILIVIVMTTLTKVTTSYLLGKHTLGKKESLLLGLGLSVKLSTSIVIIKLLFDKGMISKDLFSVLIGATIALTFIIPLVFSRLIHAWRIGRSRFRFLHLDGKN